MREEQSGILRFGEWCFIKMTNKKGKIGMSVLLLTEQYCLYWCQRERFLYVTLIAPLHNNFTEALSFSLNHVSFADTDHYKSS